ncbi:ABC transporter ATP-binding protein [Roseomonas sp. OT10]|uniref:ABC transporter ATP-binding protein n=1 Tax=Roseomonas cutis TaxID=2897332 RepID=UPI001E495CE4|nr:ABC transporter ATP-binding protein [Roseomonas sp. OT10]UFN49815.1 ABC transporter ATP-binding protein [Roseomonas sp. OT10]
MTPALPPPTLWLEDVTIALGPPGRRVPVVEGVSLRLDPGRILCVVGESGSGKSVTAMALMRLLPPGITAVTATALRFAGTDLLALDERGMNRLRGDRMAMIFQEPMTSLNPVFTIGDQIGESLRVHRGLSAAAARARALEALRAVGVPAAERRLDAYPHELSGGLRQRAMIAMALATEPALIIADEPTTALDVTVQAGILALLAELRDRTGTAILLITHDLGVVAEVADAVCVMYAGQVVERAPAATLFQAAQHPYTLALLAARPSLSDTVERLEPIPGRMPAPGTAPPGCRFAPRCPFAAEICAEPPPMRAFGPEHDAACWRAPVDTLAEAPA